METSPIEQKIINATIECIEKYGVKGTTNRQIAIQAGVNSAAVNYYFRSKENLINRCMQVTLANAFDWEGIKDLPAGSPKERCNAIFTEILLGGLNFPGIARAHFYDLIVDGNYTSLLVSKLNGFLENLVNDLKDKGSKLSDRELYLACTQITSAVMMLILTPKIYEKKFGLDLQDREMAVGYVNRLVDGLFD
ncbi:MAG: TetR family transcriptional regulator [Leptolinea sp.]